MTFYEGAAIALQVLLAGAAIFAALAALNIARRERRQTRLLTELEYAVRLSINRNRGGSTDREEVKRMGAEGLALSMIVGERWVPRQYARALDGMTVEQLRAQINELETTDSPQWVKDQIEAGLAVRDILETLYADSERPRQRGRKGGIQ